MDADVKRQDLQTESLFSNTVETHFLDPRRNFLSRQGLEKLPALPKWDVPVQGERLPQAQKNLPINYGAAVAWVYGRIAAFTDTDPLATGQYFQDAQTRSDWKFDIADDAEFQRIMDLVAEGLKQGALGIGVNAGYAPGYGQKEYFALAELATGYGVATCTHVCYASNL
ncbi:hypothetical protein AB9K41_14430 [Cribrihabitans sp. XS_ASV171]